MASASPGKRRWKCPECGNEFELSTTQLDPIACDACLTKMKTGGRARPSATGTANGSGPIGVWSALPEIVKLSAVLAAFLAGLWFGYLFGRSTAPKPTPTKVSQSHPQEAPHAPATAPTPPETHEQPKSASTGSDESAEERPPAPGPNYHWVKGRLLKDGTRGKGYWAKNRGSGSSE